MQRKASIEWSGPLRGEKGQMTGSSGASSELSYSYTTRAGKQLGTNPEEMVASAYAGCFTMTLSSELEKLGLKFATLHTDATVSFEREGSQWKAEKLHLVVQGRVPGVTSEEFEKAVQESKKNCPISQPLKANITLEAKLLSGKEGANPVQ